RHTDYTLLAAAGYTQQCIPRSNPPVRDRHNAVNLLLRSAAGDIRLKIHPRCQTLLRGLETVHLKPGATYIEHETRVQHITTALGYLIAQRFSAQPTPPPTNPYWK